MIKNEQGGNKMRVTVHYGSYNQRRYGKPWIGKITSWPVGGKAEIKWGSYLGDDDGGECEIEAEVGDIIRSGQKDGRGNGGSNDWFVVNSDGTCSCIDQSEARVAYNSKQEKPISAIDFSKVSDGELLAEVIKRGLKL